MKKVYVSSTYNDLKEHRAAVEHALRKMNYQVCCMEDYVATDERTDVRCMEDVTTADFYVGIIAQRYGWIPPGRHWSIIELEYRKAGEQPNKTRCLMFVLDPGAEWPLPFVDAVSDPEAAAPHTTSVRDPPAWAAPRTRTHRSIPAPPTPRLFVRITFLENSVADTYPRFVTHNMATKIKLKRTESNRSSHLPPPSG